MKSPLVISLQSAIRNPQSAIIVLFIVMLAASWQRWTQPLIDHGREMNLPTRILAGEKIYSDVQVLYGPFAPHFNALLYRVFGIHLSVLKAAGVVCAILILLMLYRLARALMSEWESFLVAGMALALCALKSTANYIQPYAYAALYGLVFTLGSLVATVSYIERPAGRRAGSRLVLAGSLAGLSLISKPEIALAGLAAGLAALIVESIAESKPLWLGAAAFSAPVVLITTVTYAVILRRTPLRVLLEDNHVLFTGMPPQLIYFNRHVSGLAQWPSSLWFSLAGIGIFALWVGMCAVIGAIASRKQAEWRGTLKSGLIIVCAGALWSAAALRFSSMSSNVTPFASSVFILPALIGLIIRDCWKATGRRGDGATGRRGDFISSSSLPAVPLSPCPPVAQSSRLPVSQSPLSAAPSLRILLIIAVFSFVAILRAIFNVATTGPYAPFFLPASIIVYLYLLFHVAPAMLAKTDSIRANIRRAAMLMTALMIVAIGVNSAIRLRWSNTFTVSSPRGSFITVPEIGAPLQAAIRYADERTGPDDYLLAAPQATTINFLAARRYPLREEIIHPGFLAGEKELNAIKRIKALKTPLILIVNIDTSEFGDRAFGVDYNQGLMQWVVENYRLAARFDSANSHSAKLGDKPFFILAYEQRETGR
ncbi:MAG TPA: glycosyltransferase family 39 protein [Blastocatellia bacterium]|jgi:hypothetical protein|nr:glycosyltransferase family 39 protein [Blastocatellia bacterium]